MIIGDPWAKERLSRLYIEMMENLIKGIQGAARRGIVRSVNPNLLAYFNLAINEAAMLLTAMNASYDIQEVIVTNNCYC